MHAVERSIRPGEWFMVDRGRKIAVLVTVTLGPKQTKLVRSVTYEMRSEDRALIGYFPDMRTAAYVTWGEWVRATTKRPAQSSSEN